MYPVLCIDYGEKHLGLAVAHTSLAEPLEVILFEGAEPILSRLIAELGIKTLVVGLSEGEMAVKSKQFAKSLAKKHRLTLFFEDETLTSQDTRRRLAQSGMKRGKREQKIDHYVAAAILEAFLDDHTS